VLEQLISDHPHGILDLGAAHTSEGCNGRRVSPHPRQHPPPHLLRIALELRILAERQLLMLDARDLHGQPDQHHKPVPPGDVGHQKAADDDRLSDQGSYFTSPQYTQRLVAAGVRISLDVPHT
jgi:hypothetical protein